MTRNGIRPGRHLLLYVSAEDQRKNQTIKSVDGYYYLLAMYIYVYMQNVRF